MEIVEIGGLTVLVIALLALAGSFMARATTSVNIAWMQGIVTAVTGGRTRLPGSLTTLMSGDDPAPEGDDEGARRRS